MKTRIERDSMGELEVLESALYGAQTQRAINNFPISGKKMPKAFIEALIQAKAAAASANKSLGLVSCEVSDAIIVSSAELLADENFMEHFPVDVYQTGSGTSSNMNANEVIANLASKKLGMEVSANDHVNYGQSSNDIIPTCIHISSISEIKDKLMPALSHLRDTISQKAKDTRTFVKTGRTHLMDAMPIRFDQCLSAWATQIDQDISLIESIIPKLSMLAQGGTAVGTGINAHPDFSAKFCEEISSVIGHNFQSSDNFFTHIATQDSIVALSGQLKTLAVSVMKISNDLRWMNSGPLAGLGEIELEALQPGSSIMPGKVNPVIPEAAAMVCAQVIGNDYTISFAGTQGQLELNVYKPLMASKIIESLKLLSDAIISFNKNCIIGLKVNKKKITEHLNNSLMLVTALNNKIGYYKAAEIANNAYKNGTTLKEEALKLKYLSEDEFDKWVDPKKMTGK